MKKIQREVKTYKDIYVSVDGKEFANEADCMKWEASYKGTIEASWRLVKKLEVNSTDLGLPWSSDDHECYVVEPKSIEDITLINAYIQSSTDIDRAILTTAHIGGMIVLNFGYDHDYCDMYVLSEHIDKIKKYIAALDSKMHESDGGSNDKL